MFKKGDIIVLTDVPQNKVWENKRMIYGDNNFHYVLDYIEHKFNKGDIVFFTDGHLAYFKAKLYKEKKNHLPKWF